MRKFVFLAVLGLSFLAGQAQVDVFEGSLRQALAKANAENKQVVAMVSTTWCGPCKAVVAQILPLREVGEYMNPRFVFIKYNVDVDDPDQIVDTYGVQVFPTYLFLDAEGREVTREVGGAADAEKFIEKMEKSASNPIRELKSRFEADPARYGEDYLEALTGLFDVDKMLPVMETLFSVSDPDFFLEKYWNQIMMFVPLQSGIVTYMLENDSKMRALKGEDYRKTVQSKSVQTAWNAGLEPDPANRAARLEEFRHMYTAYPALQGAIPDFIVSQQSAIQSRDIEQLCQVLMNQADTLDQESGKTLLCYIGQLAAEQNAERYVFVLNRMEGIFSGR